MNSLRLVGQSLLIYDGLKSEVGFPLSGLRSEVLHVRKWLSILGAAAWLQLQTALCERPPNPCRDPLPGDGRTRTPNSGTSGLRFGRTAGSRPGVDSLLCSQ